MVEFPVRLLVAGGAGVAKLLPERTQLLEMTAENGIELGDLLEGQVDVHGDAVDIVRYTIPRHRPEARAGSGVLLLRSKPAGRADAHEDAVDERLHIRVLGAILRRLDQRHGLPAEVP